MNLLYHLGLRLYWVGIFLAGIFNIKARKRFIGSKDWKGQLNSIPKNQKRIWMHAASYGEFEQGRPVFDQLRNDYPDHFLILTFFSPSGFDAFRNYKGADLVLYLPFDFSWNADVFVRVLHPQIALFVKYEFWVNYLKSCKKNDVPVVYFSSIFRSNQHFFKPYGRFFRSALRSVNHFFVQQDSSVDLLKEVGVNQVTVTGDTRTDRVLAVKTEDRVFSEMESFKSNQDLLVAGSTWDADEQLLREWLNQSQDFKLIVAPHELTKERIDQVRSTFKNAVLWSESSERDLVNASVLIIDQMGILKYLYRYGTCSYIGGGFGKGIHNTLEALVWETPVFFGPHYEKFEEAKQILRLQVGASVKSAKELDVEIQKYQAQDPQKIKSKIVSYFEASKGATSQVFNYVSTLIE